MTLQSFADEAGHITELRRQVARLAADRLPRERRIALDRDHAWDRADFAALADLGVI